ncbi:LacI family DNA-binding transcriptional regulator [Hymenobacter sp. AT01-02]|uniref:LacI family DNA-binding transcriptional regulator n=1 Tax=Hymenobacter sp. AT01-02 TaxID=1571877 RepID=UPI00137914E9|nr:LacI family DNA-binding transcriptional regulator [Hymenobacter sp. AT01-02]
MSRNKASISDLARQLGVSVSTVSRALSDKASISDATKKKVWKLAKELHYQPIIWPLDCARAAAICWG